MLITLLWRSEMRDRCFHTSDYPLRARHQLQSRFNKIVPVIFPENGLRAA
jgi:hypothetical protein